jgi:hypothetical protein
MTLNPNIASTASKRRGHDTGWRANLLGIIDS